MWHQVECAGRAPSPRVWFASCHAAYGQWLVLGGSEWQFDEPAEAHDYSTLYALDLRARSWSSLAEPGPARSPPPPRPEPESEDESEGEPAADAAEAAEAAEGAEGAEAAEASEAAEAAEVAEPPWAVASALVPLGGRQLLYLGGSMPHRIGPEGLTNAALRHWRDWYTRLDRPSVFDRRDRRWAPRTAALGSVGQDIGGSRGAVLEERVSELLLRSHLAAAYMPERNSVIVLGGSRYFTGEYFHDLLELNVGESEAPGGRFAGNASGGPSGVAADELPADHPLFMQRPVEGRSRLTRGLRGRLRGMTRDGQLELVNYRRILAEF